MTIEFSYKCKEETLYIKKRQGKYDGMLETRTFNIIFVREGHGAGISPTHDVDVSVNYIGEEISVKKP